MLSKNGLVHAYKSFVKYSSLLCELRHRNLFLIRCDMILSVLRGVTPAEYYMFGFDVLPRAARKNFVPISLSRKASRELNDHCSWNILENKFYAGSVLAPYYKRPCIHTAGLSLDDFKAFAEKNKKFIYKPVGTNGGDGVKVFDTRESDPEEAFNAITAMPRGVLEGWIVQHEELNKLSDRAVHTVRLHTIHDGDAGDIDVFGACLTVAPFGEIANLHFDSVLAMLVNCETGVVYSNAIDREKNEVYELFPGTDIPVKGYRLPDWDRAISLVKAAAAAVPEIRFIGWDVAFSKDGPVICEGNCRSVGVMNRQSHLYGEAAYAESGRAVIEKHLRRNAKSGR